MAGGEGLSTEEPVPFTYEIFQLAVRCLGDEIASWYAVETIQHGGVCTETVVPMRVSSDAAGRAIDVAKVVIEGLGMAGMLAAEVFVDDAGCIPISELAACPRNSGHWTTGGAVMSQLK